MLWVEKYKPRNLKEYVDQKEAVEFFLKWIENWKPGSKALLIYGPPGIGKSALVEAFAAQYNYELIALNASDVRSAERIRAMIGEATRLAPLLKRSRLFVIDEIDGMTGKEDKGGIGEVIRLIRSSAFPIVLIANDPFEKKLRPLRDHVELLPLKRIPKRAIEQRLAEICKKEGIEADKEVLSTLAERSNGDLRAAINDLETIARGKRRITLNDLEVLGYREREESIFDALKVIFKTKRSSSARLAIVNVDMDPEELFWWIENNVINEYERPEEIVKAYEALAKADLFRQRVVMRQNWSFRGYMIDLMTAGVAMAKKEMYKKFTKYKYPSRLIILGGTKAERKEEREALLKLASQLHCSTKKVKSEFLPFLKLMGKKE